MEMPQLDFTPTVPVFLRRQAARYGERDFVVTPDRRMSYAEAERTTRRVAKAFLAMGAGKGTRIGYLFGNGTDWIVTWLAAARIGALAMPFSTAYRPPELLKALRLGDVDTLVTSAGLMGRDNCAFVEAAVPGLSAASGAPLRLPSAPYLRRVLLTEPAADRAWAGHLDLRPGLGTDVSDIDPDVDDELLEAVEADVVPADPMFVIFTSGTTAEPKGVIHTHGTWVRHGRNMADCNDVAADQRVLGGMPLFWIGGVSHALGPMMHRGSTFLTTDKFDAEEMLALALKEAPTELGLFPGMIHRLTDHIRATGADVSSVPALAPRPKPAEPVDPALKARSLGMTETCAAYIASGPRDFVMDEADRGAFGFPVRHMQYRIADLETGETLPEGVEGEICVRGYSVMHGMCKKERHEVFDDDGWYHTGDKGFLKGDYIHFTGRAKDLIKSAGANVAPREVEVVLDAQPEVLMSFVVGLPDEDRGELVAAVVVPAAGAAPDPVELVTRANEALSSYKVPRKMLVLPEADVPYLATGKPDRAAITRLLADRGEAVTPRR